MSVASDRSNPSRRTGDALASPLVVSAYDRVASLIIALLLIIGVVVFCLLIAWLSMGIFRVPQSVPVQLEELGGGVETGIGTEGQQIEAPDVSEIARESDIIETQLPDTLSAILDAAALQAADLERLDERLERENAEAGGRSTGTGDNPAKGTGGGSGGGAARPQRWEIRFEEGNSLETYARQLDFFGIELGILGAANEVTYLSRLSQPKPTVRTGSRGAEGRMYMTWSRGDLDKTDRELFARAGVDPQGRIILKFLTQETETLLATVERQFKNREAKDIRRTRFGIKAEGAGFAFFVISQEYF